MTPATVITFRVYGVPQPGGSKKGFYSPKSKRVHIVEDCKRNAPWRESVRAAALAVAPAQLLDEALMLRVLFLMPRPKGHYRTGKHAGQLRPDAPFFHTSKPDVTKLVRSLEDALTGVIWKDDARLPASLPLKIYTEGRPGAVVRIEDGFDLPDVGLWYAHEKFNDELQQKIAALQEVKG